MQGILIIISGFSGVGKGTLVKELLKRYPEEYALSISATSRAPRTGEREGVEYFYKTRETFEKMIEDGELLEYTQYNGNYYGTPKDYVLKKMQEGVNVILEIEVEGGRNIKNMFPEDTMLIFLIPPSATELRSRLIGRGTETTAQIDGRLARGLQEIDYLPTYDFITMNDDFETCFNELHTMISIQKKSLNNRRFVVPRLKSELQSIIQKENE